jgi:flagellar basal-body rod modification protein FlgD
VKLEQTTQATYALGFVGQRVVVDGSTAPLANGSATWNLTVPKPTIATINIKSASGQSVFSGNYTLGAGRQPFVWNGKDASGLQWPDGNYTISIAAQDASGQPISIPAEIEATVDSADLTQSPPVLSIAGQNYTLDKIKRIVRSGA